jgi:hypothetical protein
MDPAQIVAQRALQVCERFGAEDADRAQMAYVEGDSRGSSSPVLGHGPRRVRQRHLPTTERNHFGAEIPVRGVQR